ncbi:MAG: tryptophan-rich sensory protein [Alphaproteobacteria bacterium]|nr:tryptophan-rich sensory protein [Alphaproteobacteria bacterium]
MPETLSNFKIRSAPLLLLCACTGVFFAFILEQYWPKIQADRMTLKFPISSAVFYIFCISAYLMQGLAFLFLSAHSKRAFYETAFLLFWAQFILSVLWLGLFFGLKLFGLAFFELLSVLLILSAAFYFFRAIKKTISYLLLPSYCLLLILVILNAWFVIV